LLRVDSLSAQWDEFRGGASAFCALIHFDSVHIDFSKSNTVGAEVGDFLLDAGGSSGCEFLSCGDRGIANITLSIEHQRSEVKAIRTTSCGSANLKDNILIARPEDIIGVHKGACIGLNGCIGSIIAVDFERIRLSSLRISSCLSDKGNCFDEPFSFGEVFYLLCCAY
jgi:hypothetical protein